MSASPPPHADRAVARVLVAAVARNGVIGRAGALPWRLPGDLKHFKATTLGKPVVMGRRTYQSIGRPLPGRLTIVVTRDPAFAVAGVVAARSLPAALAAARAEALRRGADALIVAGGAELYAQTLDDADRLVITQVAAEPEGDAHFPPIDPARWRLVGRDGPYQAPGDSAAYSILTYQRA